MIDLLKILLAVDIAIFMWASADYLGHIASRPYVEMSQEIGKMDIPLGRKMKLLKNIRR